MLNNFIWKMNLKVDKTLSQAAVQAEEGDPDGDP